MSEQRPLHWKPVLIDIYADEDMVASCQQLPDGSWIIKDREVGWEEIVEGPLEPNDLVGRYKGLRAVKRSARK